MTAHAGREVHNEPVTDARTPPDAPRWTRFVALGDSFTEGLWDIDPDDDARCRGWADILAARISSRRTAAGQAPLEYANLAIRGRLLRPILTEQVPTALELQPDLVSLIGGGNDMLRPTADVDRMARNLEAAVVRLRESGADVLLGTGMDLADSPLVRRTRSRVGVYNSHIWSIARRHGAHVLDLWGMQSLRDGRVWAEDRIHLTTEGHARWRRPPSWGLAWSPTTRHGTTRSPPSRRWRGWSGRWPTPRGCASTSTPGRRAGCGAARPVISWGRSGRCSARSTGWRGRPTQPSTATDTPPTRAASIATGSVSTTLVRGATTRALARASGEPSAAVKVTCTVRPSQAGPMPVISAPVTP